MDHPADSSTELCHGGNDWYVGWQSIPMNNRPCEECEPVIVFKSGNLCMKVNVYFLIA